MVSGHKRSGSSSPHDTPTKKKKSAIQHEKIRPDGFGVNDLLSRLPTDCLLEVFKKDIAIIRTVSKRMLSIADDPCLDSIRSRCLIICQTKKGYSFYLDMVDAAQIEDASYEAKYYYEYKIAKSEDGAFVERRSVIDDPVFEDDDSESSSKKDTVPHDWPIPEQLFDALAELAQHHEIDQINLKNIAFTSNTLFKLGQVLNGHPTNVFFSEFLKIMSRIDSVYLRNYRLFAPLLDEEFMNAFAEQLRVFVNDPEGDDDDNQDNQAYRFCPASESFLQRLLHFTNFSARQLVLKAEWIIKFCIMKFNAIDPKHWRDCGSMAFGFAVDRPITISYLDNLAQHLAPEEYEYEDLRDPSYSFIGPIKLTRKRDRISATIYYIEENIGSEIRHNIDIGFKPSN
ncbi:hypothetical protein PRIPAC_74888 [Pristionchus pacificus]|uniref:Uncharacterized protein n=1 Tax=Pristionchus pacificus TaxID=54126 RepID=A0A2A6BR70_PRIPA|nr:hypothetical protein PRIPAC_74888 [Pristionchus pacificus]|eukprot:PDM68419.1 hypothetical protein PRIPAC_43921 [Pristionchus pacificus]